MILLALTTSVIALYIYRHRQGQTGWVDEWFLEIIGKVQSFSSHTAKTVTGVWNHYLYLVQTAHENEHLKKEVQKLRQKLVQLEELRIENEKLKAHLGFRQSLPYKMVAAYVIGWDSSEEYFVLRIDKGKKDGIQRGMGVISLDGVVGRVYRVSSSFSEIRTIVDPQSRIDVMTQYARTRGVLRGQASVFSCLLEYISRDVPLQIHEAVLTSGLQGIFPKGILVGHIRQIESDPSQVVKTVTVTPSVDFYRLEEVWVVTGQESASFS